MVQAEGETPKDKRGKSEEYGHNAISDENCVKMYFTESFAAREIYCSSNILKMYLPATLNFKTIHEMFIDKFLELENKINISFNHFFKKNYRLVGLK